MALERNRGARRDRTRSKRMRAFHALREELIELEQIPIRWPRLIRMTRPGQYYSRERKIRYCLRDEGKRDVQKWMYERCHECSPACGCEWDYNSTRMRYQVSRDLMD